VSRYEDHLLDHVDDLLAGSLDPSEAERVRQFCEDDPRGQAALAAAQKRRLALLAWSDPPPPENLVRHTMARINRYEQTTGRLRAWAPRAFFSLVAAAAAVLVAVNVYYHRLEPSPFDLQVYGQSRLLADSDASLRVRLVDVRTGSPAVGVEGTVDLLGPDQLLIQQVSFTTGDDGTAGPTLRMPDRVGTGYSIKVSAGGGIDDAVSNPVEIVRSWRLMLSTDKPVYQPGQTIYVRALALRRPDLRPVAGEQATLSVVDPKGNVIFKSQAATSRFGIVSAECPLAAEIQEGAYEVRCLVGATESRTTCEVSRYVLPKFRLDVVLDRTFYLPGEVVSGTIQAEYFFGQPVSGGSVLLQGQTADYSVEVFDERQLVLDASGKAAFELKVPDRLVPQPGQPASSRIQIAVRAVDAAGQEQSRLVSTVVAGQPYSLSLFPEGGALLAGVPNRMFVLATYADGRPARVQLSVPNFAENLSTNELGVAVFEVTPPGPLTFFVRATDEQGQTVEATQAFQPQAQQGGFLVRTDKAVYDGGEAMSLAVLGAGSDPVFVDLIKDAQTILTTTVEMRAGAGLLQVDLPPDLSGTIELVAYRFTTEGMSQSKSRVVMVRPAGQINIETRLDREQYRPGDKARIEFTLTDPQGQPAPGALSLAVVDEAVFSVLKERPGMEGTFFTLDQELLQPVYAIYPWTPEERRPIAPAELALRDQALFSRTWRDPGKAIEGSAGGASPWSIVDRSYPENWAEATARRNSGLEGMRVAWVGYAAGFWLLGAMTLLVCGWRKTGVTVLSVPVVVSCCPLVLLVMMQFEATRALLPSSALDMAAGMMAPSEEAMPMPMAVRGMDDGPSATPLRVRQRFPETLLWRPEIVTDDAGKASIELELADSITTWRVAASAVTAEGRLGGEQSSLLVFQPFFVDLDLPVSLTRMDSVSVPVVVYNYLDQPQTVAVEMKPGEGFELAGEAVQSVALAPGEVRSVLFPLRAITAGRLELTVEARSGESADAVRRIVEVEPEGLPVEHTANGTLTGPIDVELVVPDSAVEGSVRAFVKIYPSTFSQLVEGIDGIFQRPSGCFEQTSSTTYPNVLALDYLRSTLQSVPAVEAKAREYIHLGYQRLLGFEINGGGFEWFGTPPAHRLLTAYGLLEFTDMARVHDVDPQLVERTRSWLLSQQNADGSWEPEAHPLHDDPTLKGSGPGQAKLAATAYISWAVFSGSSAGGQAESARSFLASHEPQTISDPYVTALVANALLTIEPEGKSALPYLARLDELVRVSEDGKLAWWPLEDTASTSFYGQGEAGDVESTALAALALVRSGHSPASARGALGWLIAHRDPQGTWHSTQATVWAFKALLSATDKPLGSDQDRVVALTIGSETRQIVIPADQSEVMQQIDVSANLSPGSHVIKLADEGGSQPGYQVALRYHVPQAPATEESEPLSVDVAFDRTELAIEESITVRASIQNNLPVPAPMVILDLPLPPGFTPITDEWDTLVQQGTIARYQLTPRSIVVYLRELKPRAPLVLEYHLKAQLIERVTAPAARAWHYYDPSKEGRSEAAELEVRPRA
jgi:hypothetical protein